ncbi:unnamed protein product [Rotaria sordida]|uniref:F-box domain-containing protein n=1 Tax=Rotaria sordida TaxID=392033 RepID=A0A814V5Q9_9BILA|nr:unnamed protein product [Rotaria sordida]
MEQNKLKRKITFDYWNVNKKEKLIERLESSSEKSITLFEDFPNELFYEICDYLDVYYVYKAFNNLNKRLQTLLFNSTVPLTINISSMSKSIFQDYNKHIIIPNQHRIKTLRISNPFIVDLLFSPVRITSKFIRLETLIFDNIKSKYLLNILNHSKFLPNLSSLVIILIDRSQDPNKIYQHIFRLPVLKYCRISLKEEYFNHFSLSISTNVTSHIQHLVIDHNFSLHNLNALLSYVPQLRCLIFHCLDGTHSNKSEIFPCLSNNLTHVSINIKNITFEKFEIIIKNLFYQLEILHISTNNDSIYVDANRWKQLILSFMPNIRIFDFQHVNYIQNNNDNNKAIYDSIMDQFSSSFWSERKWLFEYQFYVQQSQNYVIFYSINQYRYTDFVDHVDIHGEEAIMSCVNYFQNATKLTLSHSFAASRVWLRIILEHIIPLKQLTTLVIDYDALSFNQLIKLLRFTPNIHTLTFKSHSIQKPNSILIQQSQTFRLISNTNTITNVTIEERYTAENIKLLAILCPRMQHLTIDILTTELESTMKFILLKTKTDLQHLCSMCIKTSRKSMIGKLKALIELERLLDNYVIKMIDSNIYLWW